MCIAREVLVEKPAKFVRRMRQGIPEAYIDLFFSQLTADKITTMYDELRPTSTAVVARIVAEDERGLPREEYNALRMFRSIVQAMDPRELVDFLMYVTGSQLMPQEDINVTFFRAPAGLARLPRVHLCGTTVELSSCYNRRAEMKQDWFSLLRDKSAYRTNMV